MDRRSLTVACLLLGAVIAWPSRKKSKDDGDGSSDSYRKLLESISETISNELKNRHYSSTQVKELKDTLVKVNTLKDSKVEDRSLSEQLWQTLNTVIKQNFSFNSILQQLAARLRDKLIGSLPIIGKVIRRDGRQRRWDKNLVNF